MSKYMFETTHESHLNEISVGIDLGLSVKYGFLRFTLSLFIYTIHFTFDWKCSNV